MTKNTDETVSISKASEIIGLPESTIRYYDREFSDYLSIPRGNNNQRLFKEKHLDDLEYIRYLIKRENMSVKEVRERLAREMSFQEKSTSLEQETVQDSIPTLTDEDQLNKNESDTSRSLREILKRIDKLENKSKELHKRLGELLARQEKIQKLLDLNLQRYNKIIDVIES